MSQLLITLSDVSYCIGDKQILSRLNFDLHAKEIVTIVGPNGAGKTTLLSLALGLIKPTSGTVKRYRVEGQDLRIGYVPQSVNCDATLPLTVSEFMGLSKSCPGQASIKLLLNDLQLSHLASIFLSNLSGGELRRVLFARALLNRPHLLVLDEPTAGVDISGQEAFYHQLNELRQHYQFTILMVSHDLHLVMSTTDRVICLNQHICCQGKPAQVIHNPQYQALFAKESQEVKASLAELAFYQHDHEHQ
ncbi:MAG: zinc ABC transporter ATP-binding protein ZnuC [Gammaproteobacteria bacterium]|nr:MAG: zinc ABC transporter ATP-binding protein ZnuC [Gammaproteobacteria bacterium]